MSSERTIFNYNFKIRTSRSRFSGQIKIDHFRGDRLCFSRNEIVYRVISEICLKDFQFNLLHEIKLNSNVNEWCFISGKNNPADKCTRYNPFCSLTSKELSSYINMNLPRTSNLLSLRLFLSDNFE